MFKAILSIQWKQTRALVLLVTVIACAIPLVSMAMFEQSSAQSIVANMQVYGAVYPMLAGLTGLLIAMAAWAPDHAGRHTYALSLPVSRARYAAMRYAAGATFIAITVFSLLLGTSIVAASGAVPEGLHVYNLALTARFALAAMVAYSIFFAISSSTPQTAGVILGAIGALLLVQFVLSTFEVDYNVVAKVIDIMLYQPGLLSVFAGRWMLVDA